MESSDLTAIMTEYDEHFEVYDNFRSVCENLLTRLFHVERIRVHSVTSRVKGRASLLAKLGRPGKDYRSPSEVSDIVGIRVITHFEDEVDRIGGIVEREFHIDEGRSIDKRKMLDPDRFGYLSLHYICSLSPERAKLLENRPYQPLVCEIQIRSILQHAWAEIEHDLGYNTKPTVPAPIRRRFSRLAGLLEIADREFTQIRDELGQYTSRVKLDILQDPSSVNIDKVSLGVFIESNATVQQVDSAMAEYVGAKLYTRSDISSLAEQLQYVGLKTIHDLAQALQSHKQLLLWQWKQRMGSGSRTRDQLMKGLCLFHLFQVMLARTGDEEQVKAALDKFEIGIPERRSDVADRIIKAVQGSNTPG